MMRRVAAPPPKKEEVKRKEMPWECLQCGKSFEREFTRGRKCVDLGICDECNTFLKKPKEAERG